MAATTLVMDPTEVSVSVGSTDITAVVVYGKSGIAKHTHHPLAVHEIFGTAHGDDGHSFLLHIYIAVKKRSVLGGVVVKQRTNKFLSVKHL